MEIIKLTIIVVKQLITNQRTYDKNIDINRLYNNIALLKLKAVKTFYLFMTKQYFEIFQKILRKNLSI